ncbi:DHH family phosphoesterase [Streptococcus ruminantium]|uniref:DHH family phosphoesterase n=1 Tax=Streptococcus ruminantium TaxID=1917441 RepID=UPI0012DCA806|nr:bifunctional oligoribonuclease/PAP phosphatase NrnA [Streptococcus ruminantium]BDD42949.1 phosphoesterase [Streptococcus ruminantium]
MTIYSNIIEKIQEYDTIIIHRHQRPDPDAIGSQVGLQKLLQKNFPTKTIKATGFEAPNLSWMAEMDAVADKDYQGALVIVTDTANTARIDDARYAQGAFLIKIDHHPNEEPYGDLLWVNTAASSCSEMITEFAIQSQLVLDGEIARLLYAGIVGDTGRFLYPATSSHTFEMVARLLQEDFDFAHLSRQMDTIDFKIAKLTGYVYDHLEVDGCGAARIILTRATLERYGVTDADTSFIVGAPGRIGAVQAWGVFVEQADGSYRVRLRSKYTPINEIAKRHDGGGHPLASGANSYSLSENEQIYQEIQQVVKNASK